MEQTSRPISPHLTIWRWQVTAIMSVMHRATGIGSAIGTILLCWFLVAAAWSDEAFQTYQAIASNWFSQIILFCFTWSLFHHMAGGIKHFIWDVGAAYEEKQRFTLAWATLIFGFVVNLLVWIFLVWL